MSDLAGWVEAIGTVSTVVVAVCLWRADMDHERSEAVRADKERVQRMIVALRAEIEGALAVARRQKLTIDQTLSAIERALLEGGTVTGTDHFPPDSMSVTDAIVYRALASEIGRLPPEIIRQTTGFYTFARDAERLALLGGAVVSMLKALADILPRLMMHGEMTLRIFDRSIAADCSQDANLKLTKEEVLALAHSTGYPLEDIAEERGIKI